MRKPTYNELVDQLNGATARIQFLQKILLGEGTKRVLDVSNHVLGNVVFLAIDRQTADIRGVFIDESDAKEVAARQGLDVEPWQVQFYSSSEGNEGGEGLRYYVGQRVKYHAKREGLRGTGTITWTDDDASHGNDKICYKIARDGLTSSSDGSILIYGLEIEEIIK